MKTKKFLAHCNAVMLLIGYLSMHAVLSVVGIGNTRLASIIYDGLQLLLSVYLIVNSSKGIFAEKGKSVLIVLSLIMLLFTLRMIIDVFWGPFSSIISSIQKLNDILLTVGCVFFPAWAMICTRNEIDIQIVSKSVFWSGLITCIVTIISIRVRGILFEEERMVIGGGLHSLAIAKLGAIEIMASLHMLLNGKRGKIWYMVGLAAGIFLALASGSRGGVAGVAIAIGIYLVASLRKRLLLMLLGIMFVVLFIVNLVPILEWIGHYFPVFSGRMLLSIEESDQGGRDAIRQQCLNLISQYPIFGYGYRLNSDLTGYGPHNGILEVFLCLGIPLGLLFVYVVYIKGFVYSLAMMSDRRFVFPCLITVFSIVSSMSSEALTSGVFVFAIIMASISYYHIFKKTAEHISNKMILFRN